MNQLKPEVIAIIEHMTRESFSCRAIERATGCHTDTVAKYQRAAGLDKIDCACGRPIKHRGFCSVRYGRSPSRQEFMKQWHPDLAEIGSAIGRADHPCYFGAELP